MIISPVFVGWSLIFRWCSEMPTVAIPPKINVTAITQVALLSLDDPTSPLSSSRNLQQTATTLTAAKKASKPAAKTAELSVCFEDINEAKLKAITAMSEIIASDSAARVQRFRNFCGNDFLELFRSSTKYELAQGSRTSFESSSSLSEGKIIFSFSAFFSSMRITQLATNATWNVCNFHSLFDFFPVTRLETFVCKYLFKSSRSVYEPVYASFEKKNHISTKSVLQRISLTPNRCLLFLVFNSGRCGHLNLEQCL